MAETLDPDICCCCGRHAIGVGFAAKNLEDNRWLCAECVPIMGHIKSIRRWDPYEIKAVEAVDAATSDYAAQVGKSDIADFTDEERTGLWRCAIRAHQDEIRRLVRSGDAPW